MQRKNLKLVSGAFAALVVSALGFGATQALASTAPPAVRWGCEEWQETQCTEWCKSRHGPWATGRCSSSGSSYYTCQCVIATQN